MLGSLRRSKLLFGPHKGELKPLEHYPFRDDPKEAKVFWDVRKGLIPIVGGARESGARRLTVTTVGPDLTVTPQAADAVPHCLSGRVPPWYSRTGCHAVVLCTCRAVRFKALRLQ